jgi:hypothetical protein
MKSVLIVVLFVTALFSKECYFNKVNEVCYYKYFDRKNIYKAKAFENYYIDKHSRIYTFDKVIEVKFNSIGAIFTILNDYELEFVDKINKETYLFKVSHKRDLFPTISKLNKLKTVMKAQPHKIRKYTNTYVNRKKAAKRERLQTVLEEAQDRLDNKDKPKVEKKVIKNSQIKGTFLNPDGK